MPTPTIIASENRHIGTESGNCLNTEKALLAQKTLLFQL